MSTRQNKQNDTTSRETTGLATRGVGSSGKGFFNEFSTKRSEDKPRKATLTTKMECFSRAHVGPYQDRNAWLHYGNRVKPVTRQGNVLHHEYEIREIHEEDQFDVKTVV